ncbi:hypothetical protein [Candidatus Uabimicrobium sp. HlEnr_7]|uniref:hypothetical protein n=1 Tax=Candidatus Uabimicrobium helgolandensis TaxID=3095367 RepID=UPI0035570939
MYKDIYGLALLFSLLFSFSIRFHLVWLYIGSRKLPKTRLFTSFDSLDFVTVIQFRLLFAAIIFPVTSLLLFMVFGFEKWRVILEDIFWKESLLLFFISPSTYIAVMAGSFFGAGILTSVISKDFSDIGIFFGLVIMPYPAWCMFRNYIFLRDVNKLELQQKETLVGNKLKTWQIVYRYFYGIVLTLTPILILYQLLGYFFPILQLEYIAKNIVTELWQKNALMVISVFLALNICLFISPIFQNMIMRINEESPGDIVNGEPLKHSSPSYRYIYIIVVLLALNITFQGVDKGMGFAIINIHFATRTGHFVLFKSIIYTFQALFLMFITLERIYFYTTQKNLEPVVAKKLWINFRKKHIDVSVTQEHFLALCARIILPIAVTYAAFYFLAGTTWLANIYYLGMSIVFILSFSQWNRVRNLKVIQYWYKK